MTSQNMDRPASSRQLGYIRSLCGHLGEDVGDITQGLTLSQASHMIGELLRRARENEFVSADSIPANTINQARLGMAMKECFRIWTRTGHDIWDQHRQSFIRKVVATYNLFSEIAETMEGSTATPLPGHQLMVNKQSESRA